MACCVNLQAHGRKSKENTELCLSTERKKIVHDRERGDKSGSSGTPVGKTNGADSCLFKVLLPMRVPMSKESTESRSHQFRSSGIHTWIQRFDCPDNDNLEDRSLQLYMSFTQSGLLTLGSEENPKTGTFNIP